MIFEKGPLTVLEQIASASEAEGEIDLRAQVRVHIRNGKSWLGVPTKSVNDNLSSFLVLELQPQKEKLVIYTSEIIAVEVEKAEPLKSFLERPWLRDGERISSKLQLNRQLMHVLLFD